MQPRRSSPWVLVFRTAAAVLVTIWLFSVGAVLTWERHDAIRPAQAIVIMGAAQYRGRPSPVLRARLDHGIELWKQGFATRMVLTGGTGDGDSTSEAAASRRYVVEHGVPDAALLLETQGRTTEESLRGVAAIMETQGSKTVILVSDPFHMLRLSILARRMGLDPQTSPTRTSPLSSSWADMSKYLLSESIKVPLVFVLQRQTP
jgi:uncharacterized SAM-binding protein YcdF (DUF218 family)